MVPNWDKIQGLAIWLIRKMYPKDDYREHLGLAYCMYDRCKETFKSEKGNFQSYYRLRLYGELHRSKYRHGSIIYGVMDSDIDSLNVLIDHKDGFETEALDEIEDTRCFVDGYDELAKEIVEKLDQLEGVDPIKLTTIKNCVLHGHMLKVKTLDPTYDAAIELISTYLE